MKNCNILFCNDLAIKCNYSWILISPLFIVIKINGIVNKILPQIRLQSFLLAVSTSLSLHGYLDLYNISIYTVDLYTTVILGKILSRLGTVQQVFTPEQQIGCRCHQNCSLPFQPLTWSSHNHMVLPWAHTVEIDHLKNVKACKPWSLVSKSGTLYTYSNPRDFEGPRIE